MAGNFGEGREKIPYRNSDAFGVPLGYSVDV